MDLAKFGTELVDAIYAAHENEHVNDKRREYLGCSIVGHESDRFLWCIFRGLFAQRFPGRMYRLFETGHREEERFEADLRRIGIEPYNQQSPVSALGGHFRGHIDGMLKGVPGAEKSIHLSEYKTHSEKSFADLLSKGVKLSKPQHYTQMIVYMGLKDLTRALYLAKNKNTDALYAERVPFDKEHFTATMARAKRIIESSEMPDDITENRDDWRFKFYPEEYKDLVWGRTDKVCPLPQIDVRSCVFAKAITDPKRNDAVWICQRDGKEYKATDRCTCHLIHPHLMLGYTPEYYKGTKPEEDYIVYKDDKSEVAFTNGYGGFSSEQVLTLMRTTPKEAQPLFQVPIGAVEMAMNKYFPQHIQAKPKKIGPQTWEYPNGIRLYLDRATGRATAWLF